MGDDDAGGPDRPAPVRILNRFGDLWGRVRPAAAELDVNALLAAARKEAGLHDFGDGSFREGLDVLVESLNTDGDLTPLGRSALRKTLVDLLVGRLRVRDFAKKSELVEYEVISPPLILCGMPHSGTAVLSDLLEQDPMNRSLIAWEAANVAPPVTLADRHSDPRLVAALGSRRGRLGLAPTSPAGPTERTDCAELLAGAFASLRFETLADIPSYSQWHQACDMVPAYRHHELQLRILQSSIPTNRWVLRSPAHLWHLDAVRTVYPAAHIVWAHRDPVRASAGTATAVAARRAAYSRSVDHHGIAAEWKDKLVHAVTVGSDAIERWPAEQVFHLQHAEFVEDPVGTVERIYRTFGIELSQVGRRRMQLRYDDHRQDDLGARALRPGDVGLDPDSVRADFSDYITTFRIPSEA